MLNKKRCIAHIIKKKFYTEEKKFKGLDDGYNVVIL